MRDFSRRTEKIAICRGEWEISRSVAENVKNRDLSQRIGNFAVSYMRRNPFVPVGIPQYIDKIVNFSWYLLLGTCTFRTERQHSLRSSRNCWSDLYQSFNFSHIIPCDQMKIYGVHIL